MDENEAKVSSKAVNIYSKLINDDDFYTIIDKGSSKDVKWSERTRARIMIIDKNYKYIPELIKLVKERESKEKATYDYDKELLKPKPVQTFKPVQQTPVQPTPVQQKKKTSMFDFFRKK